MRREAGLPTHPRGPPEDIFLRAVGRLLHIDDEERLGDLSVLLARNERRRNPERLGSTRPDVCSRMLVGSLRPLANTRKPSTGAVEEVWQIAGSHRIRLSSSPSLPSDRTIGILRADWILPRSPSVFMLATRAWRFSRRSKRPRASPPPGIGEGAVAISMTPRVGSFRLHPRQDQWWLLADDALPGLCHQPQVSSIGRASHDFGASPPASATSTT